MYMFYIFFFRSYFLVSDLRTRYHQMYIPSDFFRVTPKWHDTFPPNQPMNFTKTAQFHVMSKEVDPVIEYTDTLEPPDADYLYCAKVIFFFFFFFFCISRWFWTKLFRI